MVEGERRRLQRTCQLRPRQLPLQYLSGGPRGGLQGEQGQLSLGLGLCLGKLGENNNIEHLLRWHAPVTDPSRGTNLLPIPPQNCRHQVFPQAQCYVFITESV